MDKSQWISCLHHRPERGLGKSLKHVKDYDNRALGITGNREIFRREKFPVALLLDKIFALYYLRQISVFHC